MQDSGTLTSLFPRTESMKKQPSRISAPRNQTSKTSGTRHTKLTLRQRRFIDGKLQGRSSAASARVAGYAESVARKADVIIGGSPDVQAAMAEILRAAGITDELLAERIWQGLNATIVSKKTAHARREVLVDYRERREMVELVLKLSGQLTNKHEIRAGDEGSSTIVIEFVGTECDRCGGKGPVRYYGSNKLCEKCADLQVPPQLPQMVEDSNA